MSRPALAFIHPMISRVIIHFSKKLKRIYSISKIYSPLVHRGGPNLELSKQGVYQSRSIIDTSLWFVKCLGKFFTSFVEVQKAYEILRKY